MTSGRRSIDPPLCRVNFGWSNGGDTYDYSLAGRPSAAGQTGTLMVEPDSAEPTWKTRAACRGKWQRTRRRSGGGGRARRADSVGAITASDTSYTRGYVNSVGRAAVIKRVADTSEP